MAINVWVAQAHCLARASGMVTMQRKPHSQMHIISKADNFIAMFHEHLLLAPACKMGMRGLVP
jgi:hypothetical protein